MRVLLSSAIRDAMSGQVEVLPAEPHNDAVRLLANEGPPAAAVLDLDLGVDVDTPALITFLLSNGLPAIVVSAAGTPYEVQECVRAGALSFVSKDSLGGLAPALMAVIARRPHLSRELAGKLADPVIPGVHLSSEHRRTLALFSAGMSIESIAQSLGRTTADIADAISGSFAAYQDAM